MVERFRRTIRHLIWRSVNPEELEQLHEAADLLEEALKALERQTDNMAFIVNHVGLPNNWTEKFASELTEDRAILTKSQGEKIDG